MKKTLNVIALFVSCFCFISTAHAQDNRIRLKASTNHTQGMAQSYDDGAGIAVDYSYTLLEHFELGASFTDVFRASSANLYTLTLNPSASYGVDRFHFYAGPSIGFLFDRENTGMVSSYERNEFGFGGFAGVDFSISDHWSLNLSYEYVRSFNSPILSVSSFGGGIGFQF